MKPRERRSKNASPAQKRASEDWNYRTVESRNAAHDKFRQRATGLKRAERSTNSKILKFHCVSCRQRFLSGTARFAPHIRAALVPRNDARANSVRTKKRENFVAKGRRARRQTFIIILDCETVGAINLAGRSFIGGTLARRLAEKTLNGRAGSWSAINLVS